MHAVGRACHGDVVPLSERPRQVEEVAGAGLPVEPRVPHGAGPLGAGLVEEGLNRGLEGRLLSRFRGQSLRILRRPQVAAPVQDQFAVGHARIALQPADREGLHRVIDLAVPKCPPGRRWGNGGFIADQPLDLVLSEGGAVDSRVLDGAGEEANFTHFAPIPQTQQHERFRAEGSWAWRGVAGIDLAVAVKRDAVAFVNDRHLHGRVRPGRLRQVGFLFLLALRATKEIAPGHPSARCPLAEYQGVEVFSLHQGHRASAPLGQIGGINPRHQRLVLEQGGGGRRDRLGRRVGVKRFFEIPRGGQGYRSNHRQNCCGLPQHGDCGCWGLWSISKVRDPRHRKNRDERRRRMASV